MTYILDKILVNFLAKPGQSNGDPHKALYMNASPCFCIFRLYNISLLRYTWRCTSLLPLLLMDSSVRRGSGMMTWLSSSSRLSMSDWMKDEEGTYVCWWNLSLGPCYALSLVSGWPSKRLNPENWAILFPGLYLYIRIVFVLFQRKIIHFPIQCYMFSDFLMTSWRELRLIAIVIWYSLP